MNANVKKFTFFWKGPLSQWKKSPFVLDNIEYNCAEQYMMASKALLFKDEDIFKSIMKLKSPKTHQKLGREVCNFDNKIWQENELNGFPRCCNIVWRGNMAKFSQNKHLLDELFSTLGTCLVEASPYDNIWGVGLCADNQLIKSDKNWTGLNWLGKVLNSVRDSLKNDSSPYMFTNDARKPMM